MKKILKLFFLATATTLMLGSINAYAMDDAPAPTASIEFENNSTEDQPLGILTQQEITEAESELNSDPEHMPSSSQSRHFAPMYHEHIVTNVYNRYLGQKDRGIQAVGRYSPYNTKLTLTNSLSVSNGWNTSIAFDANAIKMTLGYNASQTTSQQTSYGVDIPYNQTVGIRVYDMYDVSLLNVETRYYNTTQYWNFYSHSEYGTGFAQQWLRFEYRAERL